MSTNNQQEQELKRKLCQLVKNRVEASSHAEIDAKLSQQGDINDFYMSLLGIRGMETHVMGKKHLPITPTLKIYSQGPNVSSTTSKSHYNNPPQLYPPPNSLPNANPQPNNQQPQGTTAATRARRLHPIPFTPKAPHQQILSPSANAPKPTETPKSPDTPTLIMNPPSSQDTNVKFLPIKSQIFAYKKSNFCL
jgi:hypothetical protein